MPMVADILRHYPEAQIDWVVEEAYVDLVKLNPLVRKVIPFALRRWRKTLWSAATRAQIHAFRANLQSEQYDFVFDTQGLLKTGLIMHWARCAAGGKKVGMANGSEGSGYEGLSRIFHDISVPLAARTHAVQRGRLVAAAALSYSVDTPPDFALQVPDNVLTCLPAPSQPYAVFFHGTARDTKKWQSENWVAVGQILHQQGIPVLLPWGTKKEQEEAQQLAAQLPNAQLLPALSMLEVIALARHAALVVGLDTGLTHIAAAYNRPTIELYCDSPRWKTEGDWSDNIINLGDACMPPSVDEVRAALARLSYSQAG